MNLCILSGGQTGADQAALIAASRAGLRTGGWAPLGWHTEEGPAPWLADYGLRECPEPGYSARTRRNVADAGAILWFGNPYTPGGKLTLGLAQGRNLDTFVVLTESTPADVADWLCGWVLAGEEVTTFSLLVAGNRESRSPGIGARTATFLSELFGLLLREGVAGKA
jgi:hypothetical protein